MMPTGHRVCLAHNISRGQERRVVSAQGLRGTGKTGGGSDSIWCTYRANLGDECSWRGVPFWSVWHGTWLGI